MTLFFTICAVLVLAMGFVVFFGAPYVPSKRRELEQALDMLYKVGKDDVLVDVGSGDGVVLRVAARRGAKAIGYELNPILVAVSRWLSRGSKNISTRVADMWQVKFPPETTVVYAFVVSRDSAKLARKMQKEATRLRRPLALITYGCLLPDDIPFEKTQSAHTLYRFTP